MNSGGFVLVSESYYYFGSDIIECRVLLPAK